ncbi:MAG TPA: hypothetical protein VFM68_04320 [Candidatus Saccharimonadales bacterium]|nr:hypothetical protein [Candidatus Saccharimonadales bacterium]
MSELDFDELDKAVNTLMSDVPKVDPPKTDGITTLNIDSTLSGTDSASRDTPHSASSKVNPPQKESVSASNNSTAAAPAPLATRRGGRFMDVVHPSSNMKGSTKAPQPTSRQGITIEPSKNATADQPTDDISDKVTTSVTPDDEPEKAPETVKTETAPTPEKANTTKASSDATNSESDWPDPLDMTDRFGEKSTSDSTPAATNVKVAESAPKNKSTEADEPGDDELFTIDDTADKEPSPLTSPFLTDAKVTKRPLGGAVNESHDEPVAEPSRAPVLGALVVDDDNLSTDDPDNQLPAAPSDETPLPPELQSDLMAIETDGGTSASASPNENQETPQPETAKPAKETEKAGEKPTSASSAVANESSEKPVEIPAAATEPSTKAVAAGPTSITQQYQEEQSTSDQTNGSIYDTDSYHQPLAHPAKKKSDWLWVVWILLILAIGGGSAAALYFLDII